MIKLFPIRSIVDTRGELLPINLTEELPFECKRIYFLKNLDHESPRGFHAHHNLWQLMLCLKGECDLKLDDGQTTVTHRVQGNHAVLIEPMIWHEMHHFSKDCLIVVFASDVYSELDYIREYAEFLKLVAEKKND